MFNILAVLVFVLAWLGFLVLVAILAGMMESKPARPRPKPCRSRYHARLVTIKPAISPTTRWSLYPNGDNRLADPAELCHQSPIPTERGLSSPTERGLYIDELMYHAVERFDDPDDYDDFENAMP
jgi:hypothetical protein